MRRLRDFQRRQESVYADVPQQSLAATDEVVKVCQWYRPEFLEQKWKLLWNRAILPRSHHICSAHPSSRTMCSRGAAGEIASRPRAIDRHTRTPPLRLRSLRQIINSANTAHQPTGSSMRPFGMTSKTFWGRQFGHVRPSFFYLDGVDEEFSSAPMYWLHCQKGLFYEVMTLLRDAQFGVGQTPTWSSPYVTSYSHPSCVLSTPPGTSVSRIFGC